MSSSSSMINPTPPTAFVAFHSASLATNHKHGFSAIPSDGYWQAEGRSPHASRLLAKDSNIVPGAPEPPSSNFPHWISWILGTIFSVILPALRLKGGFLQLIGKKVDEVVDVVEDVVDAVEDVAEVVDDVADAIHKVSSDLADDLPNDSPLKGVATWVENASKEVSDGAEQTLDFIDKVEDFKEELEKKVDEVLDSVDDESKEEKAVGSKKEVVAQVSHKDEEHAKEGATAL